MDTAPILICALLLDAALGEPAWLWKRLPHPAVLMGRAIAVLDRRLNHGPDRKARGVAALALLVLGGGAIGGVLSLFGPVVVTIAAAILLAQRSLVQHVSAVADGLRMSLAQGRRNVAMIVSRDTTAMDTSATARAAIESAAENLSDGVIAPAFWFLIGGLPGLVIYKVVNTADSMIGYRTEKYLDFGWAAARMDDLLNWVPARLTALMIAALSGGLHRWSDITDDAHRHRSPNAGWPEAAMARALKVALAGPRSYDGTIQPLSWVNAGGRVPLTPADIDAACAILWKTWGVFLGLTALVLLL
ncbi:adenosylcobinamide-phosphate synthase CbiB [Pseudosulfitobacter koreensis]|uniref:Cobalamin biosynthesis protein CobD n=1 Tax=Pseudosulfitobacter koreensis TaxID=2968472 RepID=A0ABT1YVQ2_9RHOB|nr:adenosylcobinamide-phosphate synthase CbiB [Pseudosulfitobacter koreense]MCR8824970.1 adenosylcobinamide-phosphate synthase CbiB [Pseudosulfitobacter koreense]